MRAGRVERNGRMIEVYFNKEDFNKITLDNICDYCKAHEDECGEYRECCYKALAELGGK